MTAEQTAEEPARDSISPLTADTVSRWFLNPEQRKKTITASLLERNR
jgi:hypothetical protein